MNDDPAEPDFSNSENLKLYFEDIDEEIANLHGLFQNQRAELDAITKAFMALLSALDDNQPALRSLVVDDLNNEVSRACNPPGEQEPNQYNCAALIDLTSDIETAKKLFDE